MVRAKFRVVRIERSVGSVFDAETQKYKQDEVQTIVMMPVVGSGESENAQFWAATPSGEIKLGTVNEAAASQFELQHEYYVDFSPA